MQIADMPMMRVFYAKTGRAKYISHLDLVRTLTRALRRSGLPCWYTQGFNPHLYMTFALPLPLGCEGQRESLDLRLTRPVSPDDIVAITNRVFPPGLRVLAAAPPVNHAKEIAWADYGVTLMYESPSPAHVGARLDAFLAQESIEVSKRSKRGERQIDIKPHVQLLEQRTGDDGLQLRLRCAAGNRMNIAPTLFLQAFDAWADCQAARTAIVRETVLLQDLEIFQ